MLKVLKHARLSLKESKESVNKSYDDCLQDIQSLREQFNARFDQLEQRTVLELEQEKTAHEITIQTGVDKIDDITERLQKLFNDLNDGTEKSEASSYIDFAKCDDVIWTTKVLLKDITSKGCYMMSFEPFKEITECLSSFEMLGEVICKTEEKPLPGADHVFEVEEQVTYNVKCAGDERSCNISGICRLATGEFLLADSSNSNIKLLDSNYQEVSTCDVPELPQGLCLIGEREAAVAVNSNADDRHEIHFLCVRSGALLKTRRIKLQHGCNAVAHHGGDLYITTLNALHVYNISSGLDKQLYSDEEELTVLGCAVSPDGNSVFISNAAHHKLITLNKDGTKLSAFTHRDLPVPNEVHVTQQGHMFVTDYELGTVVQVVNDWRQTVKTLAGKGGALTRPWALCFNSDDRTLIVSQDRDDNIVELQLKH